VLEEALKLDPESGDVFNQLGLVYFELGRKQDGFAAARRYLTLAPQEANAHDSLGLLYQWNGQYDEAIAAYREALRLKPGAGMMMVHLGNAFYQTGRYRQAIEEYERSIRAGPSARERTRGLGHIAWVLWRKKDLARLRQVRDQFEREGRAWLFGNVLLGESPAPKAGEADSWRRQEWPHRGRGSRESLRSTYSALALAALHEGRNEDALAHAQLALRERPPYYEPDRSDDILAECYLGLGRLDLAIAEYRRVLEAWPRLALARYRLGLALARTGDQQAAAAEFRRFLAEWKDADDGVPEVMDARRRMGS
jgi:tetratricopeptide (TPR) repeat protein